MLHTTVKPDLIFHIEKSFYIDGEQKGMLWRNQTKTVQQQFVAQAERILQAIQENRPTLEFSLPEKVILIDPFTHAYREESVPTRYRHQTISRRLFHRSQSTLSSVLQRLSDLQSSSYLSLSLSANILRYWIARLWLNQLPKGEQLPQIPSAQSTPSATDEPQRYFPEWLLFNAKGEPLFSNREEAEQRIHAIESTLEILLSAMAIDSEIVEEEAFRSRYTALIKQWTEQGRLYSEYLTKEIISTIHQRESQHTLNRGLTIHLPYFDDQLLEIEYLDLEVVPPGRIPFEEVFLYNAVQNAKQQVFNDKKLSPTTRQHLLSELELLESSCADCPSYLPAGTLSPYYHWVKASPSNNALQNSSKSEI
ncbi:MAG: hypothetical protein N3D16_02170 [Anaerolineales bacterium]|nr:hypothetical protein [Anaerolineales bacterium]